MRVKLNRGPLKNKYYAVQDHMNDFVVQAPLERQQWSYDFSPLAEIPVRRGSYHRSNVTLKNGAVVFEWMGWIE